MSNLFDESSLVETNFEFFPDSIKTFSALLILKISGIQLPAIIRGSIHSIHKTFFVLVKFNFFLITLISLLIISITFEASLEALSFSPTNKISLMTSLKLLGFKSIKIGFFLSQRSKHFFTSSIETAHTEQ